MTRPADGAPDEELIAYLDGELPTRRSHAVEAKLNTDPALRREADALRKTWDLLDFLPKPPEPPGDFTSRTLGRLERVSTATATAAVVPLPPSRSSRVWPWLALVAAVLFAAAAGYGVRAWLFGPRSLGLSAADETLARNDLRVIRNGRAYLIADDVELLQMLDSPDLFGPPAR